MTGVLVTALTVVVGVVVFLRIFGSFVWCMKQWAECIHKDRSDGDDDSNLHAPLDPKEAESHHLVCRVCGFENFANTPMCSVTALVGQEWILENDSVEALGLDFSVTEKRGDDGEVVVADLIPNDRSINLTDENKEEYVQRRFRYVLFESVSSQLVAFLKGLYGVIPPELFLSFDSEELDYFLCGSDVINVDDWQHSTEYTSNLRGHPALIWFWELVREMPNEYRQRLLHFAAGSPRVLIAGFGSLTSYDGRLCPFTLKGVPLVDDGYIWSHACFNRLDLPLHVVRRELKEVLYATLDTELYGFTTV